MTILLWILAILVIAMLVHRLGLLLLLLFGFHPVRDKTARDGAALVIMLPVLGDLLISYILIRKFLSWIHSCLTDTYLGQ